MPSLVVYVDCESAADLDEVRAELVGALESRLEELMDDRSFRGRLEVSWTVTEGADDA